jgi:putative ABC transport system permease protein
MLRNYIKITLRNIRRQKIFSLINISGLATAIACCAIVLLYVTHELSFDNFHEKKDVIYRLTSQKNVRNTWYFSPRAPWPAGRTVKELFPEVKDYTIYNGSLTDCIIRKEGELYRTEEERIVSESFFKIFTFPFLHGDPSTALRDSSSLVVTESFARRWFGTTDALGKILNINGGDRSVTGVLKDLPRNSHLQFGFLVPVSWYLQHDAGWRDMFDKDWGGLGTSAYLLMNQEISVDEFNGKMRSVVPERDPGRNMRLLLQPLDKVYLHSDMMMEEHEAEENSDMIVGSLHNLRILIVAAALLLMLACVNYTNLSTAVVGLRAKEIGVRKVCGSHRKDLFWQMISESLSLAFFSMILALFLVTLFLPVFNRYSGTHLAFQGLFNIKIIIGLLGITGLTGFLSGCYPAFYLSSLPSVDLLKRSILLIKRRKISLRHVLVVFQFALAISVIISTAVFSRQFRFIQSKFDGFDLGNTLVVIDWAFAKNHEQVKQDLLQNPHIISVSQSATPGAGFSPSSEISWPGKNPGDEPVFFHARIDYEYDEAMKPRIVEGRFFSKEIASDASQFLVNETAVKVMGMASPLGQKISYKGKDGAIIGVVQDSHIASLRYRIPPLVYEINHDYPRFNIKVDRSENIPAALKHINQTRKKYPDYRPVSYWFAKDQLSHYMKTEQTLSRVFSYVTFLTMILASLGLFGLSLFHASQKTKEIGIRKVLGSSEARIVSLLTREFIKWVLLANIIAWPAAYFLMKRWLQNYAYRVDIGFLTFVMAGVMALAVAFLTIAYRSIKAAAANPVDSLRYE